MNHADDAVDTPAVPGGCAVVCVVYVTCTACVHWRVRRRFTMKRCRHSCLARRVRRGLCCVRCVQVVCDGVWGAKEGGAHPPDAVSTRAVPGVAVGCVVCDMYRLCPLMRTGSGSRHGQRGLVPGDTPPAA
jgi:hypothetical protein